MTTVKAFDELMNQFIKELAHAFPDEPLKTGMSCQEYMKQVSPWSVQMTSRDPSFFCEENAFAKNFNLHVIWKREDCSDVTRGAIWQYISSLYMIATTMTMFPPDTLSMIEAVAENCAKNMKVDQSGKIDEKTLMNGMNSMLSQMMNSGGDNPFASLLSTPPPRRQPAPLPSSGKVKKNIRK